MARKRIDRTGERLIRMAYDLEAISVRLREAGRNSEANSIKAISSTCGNVGHRLLED